MGGAQIIANRYEIIESIGQGGMGEVFRACDQQTGEFVAIKQLRPDVSMPGLLERFEREGEALRQLNHPNIVKMLASVEENNLHYLVMEYVQGGSLEELLRHEPKLSITRVLEIALDLADALTRAHRLKITHRDIKPANVLIAEDGTPRLTDFGVARIGSRTRVTETGSLIGTYAYLSPEACRTQDLDARTDIWSFGVMLYEMLAGRLPFSAEQGAAILVSILNDPVPPLAQFRPNVPSALAHLIERMLAKDRDDRIASVRQVGLELEAIIRDADTPIVASSPVLSQVADGDLVRFVTPTPTTGTARQDVPQSTAPVHPKKISKLVWFAAIMTLIVIVGGAAAALLLLGGEPEKKDSIAKVSPVQPGEYMVLVAQLEPLSGVSERDVTRFIVTDLTDVLQNGVPFSDIRIREYPNVITSDEGARAAAEANGATIVVWGNYTANFVELEIQVGVTTAFPHLQVDQKIVDRTANVRVRMIDERQESLAMFVLGILDVLQTADGDGYEVTRSMAVLNEIHVKSPEIISSGVSSLFHAGAATYLDDTPATLDTYNEAIRLDTTNPLLYIFRAASYQRRGEFDQALRDIATARRLGPDQWAAPDYLEGSYTSAINDFEAAIGDYSRIIELRPDDWFAWNYRAALYYITGQYDLAKADYERALELGPNANFPYAVLLMMAIREGQFVTMQDMLTTIITRFPDPTQSARILDATFGPGMPSVWGPAFSAMGNVLLGQYETAVEDTQAALAIYPPFSDMYFVQGLAYCNLDYYPAAEEAYSKGIELDPNLTVLYVLRAEARARQQNLTGVMEDMKAVQDSPLADQMLPLFDLASRGELSCKDFFTFDFTELATVSE